MISLPIFQGALSSAADVPSLDLNFSGPSGFFAAKGATPTLTRGSVATYTDSAGVLRATNSNLLTNSEDFNDTSWGKNATTVTLSTVLSPNNLSQTYQISSATTNGVHDIYKTQTLTPGVNYTLSAYVKAQASTYVSLWLAESNLGGAYATFNLATKTVVASGVLLAAGVYVSSSIQELNNGWFRISLTGQTVAATMYPAISVRPSTNFSPSVPFIGTGLIDFYIWGAQIEQASYVGPYSPTTTVATNNGPRIDYDPVTLACKGLLIEEARTNIALYSEDFSSVWLNTGGKAFGSGSVLNSSISPDGTMSADTFTEDTTTRSHGLAQLRPVTAGQVYCASFYVKKYTGVGSDGRYMYCSLVTGTGSTRYVLNIDLLNGILTDFRLSNSPTNTNYNIENIGNYWRVSFTIMSVGTNNFYLVIGRSNSATPTYDSATDVFYTGDGVTSITFWGAQIEQGAFPTSYIPTTTAPVTRNADVCGIASLTGIWNATEGTSIVDFVTRPSIAGTYSLAAYKNAGGTNYLKQQRTLAAESSISAATGTIDVQTDFTSLGAGKGEMAIAYKSNDFAGVLNAGSAIADTSGATFTSASIDSLNIGRDQAGANWLNGHIARLRYFNKRLSNARLQNSTYADALDWRNVGPKYYQQFKSSIDSTIATATVSDTLSTPTGTYPGSSGFSGGVLLPDGKVFCVPRNSTTARIYDPVSDTLSTPTGTYPGTGAFIGGVLLPDGKVFCVPHNSTTARIYDPISDTLSTPTGTYPGGTAFAGGVLLPNGKVFCVPLNATAARIYDPVSDTLSTPTGTYPGGNAFAGGVLLPDGKVFCIPLFSTAARIYDPVSDTLSTPTGTYPGSNSFAGGALLPDGKVFCAPYNSTTARIYDPVSDTLSTPTGTYPGSGAFIGGVLLPDGKVFCVPYNSTTARIYDPVSDTLSTPTGTYPETGAFYGGVLLINGKVFCVPINATTSRLYGGGTSFNTNVLLSSYYNKV